VRPARREGLGLIGRDLAGDALAHRPTRRRRPARGRLTGTGRVVALLLVVLGLALGWGARSWVRGLAPADADGLPAVAAAAAARPVVDLARLISDPPLSRERFEMARVESATVDPAAPPRLVEQRAAGTLRVEYSLDVRLTEAVFEILRHGRVQHGQAIVIDQTTSRRVDHAVVDPETLPADRAYPAASIVKVITAAALLEQTPAALARPCIYEGNKYRVTRRRLEAPRRGNEASLEDALASSNNQCFSRWAVHALGAERLVETIERFGWVAAPAPGFAAGRLDPIEDDLDLGRLGSGLDGLRVTPMHVAQLAGVLAHGRLVEPWWVDRVVDEVGRSIELPRRMPDRPVIEPRLAARLRDLMVSTTTRGTARRAFRTRRGQRLLGDLEVAGKTGNLSGRDPSGRYEWFLGVAPADAPRVGVVVLQLQGSLWWAHSSELAARILREVFCDRTGCRAELASRYTGELDALAAIAPISGLEQRRGGDASE